NEHVDAISKMKFESIIPDLRRVFLHAMELKIDRITDTKGKSLKFEMIPDEQAMFVDLKEPLKENGIEELTFSYTIDHPRTGLFFTNPCPEFPDIETSAWTQMQDDYARYCFPIYDNPSHKFPTETIITVPQGFFAMSNGYLKKSEKNDNGTETFHWVQEKPIPAYLITVAASEYNEYKEDLDGLEVSYYVHKRWDKDTVYRSFGKTPKMIKFFETKLGVKYPWAKYAQVTAANFLIGGMENVSATTQTDGTLHDEKAHRDIDSDGLVAHELAHMWGGDLVTCRTWSHGWLNEGWGTQMQNEWKRHDKGDEEYLYDQYGKQQSYFNEDKNRYRRPIVKNEWERGSDVFDAHLYPGAAWRYYMLRHLVGEERWWKILGEWLTRFGYKSAYTHDLESLFTEMTGEDYGWFFDQWLYKAGYPECKIKVSHDEKLGHVHIKVEQTQNDEDRITPKVFQFPLTVEFVDEKGVRTRYTVQVNERVQGFYYPVKDKPIQVIIDPDYATLMDWNIEKPEPMWIEQLHNGTNTIQKIKAAQALGKKATPKAVEALGTALIKDKFWGTQSEIAKVLGSLKSEPALNWLLKATKIKDTKARTAVARALGQFYRNDRAFDTLKKLLDDMESYFVVAAAAASIGKTQHEAAFETLTKFLSNCPASWHDVIKIGCLEGLTAIEKEEVIDIVVKYLDLGTSDWIRRMIPNMLASLGKRYKKEHPEIKSVLERHLFDNSYRVQYLTISAASTYEDATLIPTLSKLAERAAESGIVRGCRVAIRSLSMKKEPQKIESLQKSIEDLEKENRDLKDRLDKIEAILEKKDEK
ncbi:MAG: HEAT repeat domain-containing protein, partial [Candidatus Thorarchaeota archaeon]|nr:HEAT repeat domain-containing protein [Candidatus Thorarchaeota archaeon]